MAILSRSALIFLHDLVVTSFSFLVACLLKFNLTEIRFIEDEISLSIICGGIISLLLLNFFKIHKVVVRYFSLNDAVIVFQFSCYFSFLLWIALLMINRLDAVPRVILILHFVTLNVLLLTPRVFWRILREYQIKSGIVTDNSNKIQSLIIGLNRNTEIFIRNLNNNKNSEYEIVGILDEKITRYGHLIHNVPIVGTIDMLEELLPKLKMKHILPQKLIITDYNISNDRINYYFEIAEKLGLTIARIPKITALESTNNKQVEVKSIVIEDLLGRPQAIAATAEINALINNKIIMVTGGGGTIGSELVRQLINYNPQKIVIIDSSEFNLYQIAIELANYGDLIEFKIGDVRNQEFINYIINAFKITLVFHAAALKHVPIAEENEVEAISTNFLGTKNICDLAISNNLEAVILISTDKAVNPTNIMGATKRLAEYYVNYCSNQNTNTKFITVRFGNVLGSSGSVIPLFEKQIMQGGPITLTHPEITRFFMTVREAVTLVLNAITIGCVDKNYHNGIFILNMGNSVKIYDLAVRMIKLAGLEPERDIQILITGLRPGEKLAEELVYDHEKLIPTKYNDLMFSKFNFHNIINQDFLELITLYCKEYNIEQSVLFIKKHLTEYTH